MSKQKRFEFDEKISVKKSNDSFRKERLLLKQTYKRLKAGMIKFEDLDSQTQNLFMKEYWDELEIELKKNKQVVIVFK
jgi:hypothetical protein